jgi:hypothetical protein
MQARQQKLCDALLTAGARELLGGDVERRTSNYEAPLPGLPCELWRREDHGISVFGMIAPQATAATARTLFDEEVKRVGRNNAQGLQDESSALGIPAFSETLQGRFQLLALKGESIVWLEFKVPGGDVRTFRLFAKNVLGRL